MPLPKFCPGSSIRVSPAIAMRGRGARIAAVRPIACQSASAQTIAARACPLPRSSAYLGAIAKARSSGPALPGSAARRIR